MPRGRQACLQLHHIALPGISPNEKVLLRFGKLSQCYNISLQSPTAKNLVHQKYNDTQCTPETDGSGEEKSGACEEACEGVGD